MRNLAWSLIIASMPVLGQDPAAVEFLLEFAEDGFQRRAGDGQAEVAQPPRPQAGFVDGARRGHGSWVGLMNEYGYQADTRTTAIGNFRTQNEHLEDWLRTLGGRETLAC